MGFFVLIMRKLTSEEFISKAKEIHGDKYDYSKVKYVNNLIKVKIICPKHGEFLISPNNHLNGCGCKLCSQEERRKMSLMTNDEFVKKATKLHDNFYDYSKVEYQGSKKKVAIICPIHGEFLMRPNNHLIGQGCPKCANENRRKTLALTKEEFIEKAKKVHGDLYDYSKVDYINNNAPIMIICKKHGKFEQLPYHHLMGNGCPICKAEKIGDKHRLTKEEFIEKANNIHGDKYDYSKVEYINNITPITIICKKHGEFKQLPIYHLSGNGCPKCNASHLEEEITALLKDNNIEFEYQKRFDWLGKQSLDFYIPKYNIAIECQGRQHYQSVKIFGGEEGFLKRKILDNRKKKLCEEHNIKILYYSKFALNDDVITNKKQLISLINS